MTRLPLYLNTRSFTSHILYGPYVFFPVLASLTWFVGVLILLGLWIHSGKPRYQSSEASVVFISDVGAAHQTVFMIICCLTASFYVLSLLAERWLRHIDRLPTDLRRREKILDWLAIFFGVTGAVGLVLLSTFNAFEYGAIHWMSMMVFVICVSVSAVFQTGEVWSLHKDHPDRRSLLRNSIIKVVVVSFAIVGAFAFAACYGVCHGNSSASGNYTAAQCNQITSAAAGLEWTISIILALYFLTLAADLWPAGKSSKRYLRRVRLWQEKHGQGHTTIGRPPLDLCAKENGLDTESLSKTKDMVEDDETSFTAVQEGRKAQGGQEAQMISSASQGGIQGPINDPYHQVNFAEPAGETYNGTETIRSNLAVSITDYGTDSGVAKQMSPVSQVPIPVLQTPGQARRTEDLEHTPTLSNELNTTRINTRSPRPGLPHLAQGMEMISPTSTSQGASKAITTPGHLGFEQNAERTNRSGE